MTRPEMKDMIENMKMSCAATLTEVLGLSKSWGGESLTVTPNGISVIVKE